MAEWRRLKSLVLDSVSSPITKRVYNLGLDEFFAWYGQEPRPGFTKATVAAWRVARWKPAGWVPFPSTCGSRPAFDSPAPRSRRILTQRLSTLKIQDPRLGGPPNIQNCKHCAAGSCAGWVAGIAGRYRSS
jgi:hypothetical protein